MSTGKQRDHPLGKFVLSRSKYGHEHMVGGMDASKRNCDGMPVGFSPGPAAASAKRARAFFNRGEELYKRLAVAPQVQMGAVWLYLCEGLLRDGYGLPPHISGHRL